MTVNITIVFSVFIDEDGTYKLTAEVTSATNISTHIFMVTADGKIMGVASPTYMYRLPESPDIGKPLYRTNIVTYTVDNSAQVLAVKEAIKNEVQKLINAWKDIGDVLGQETWTATSE